jgi:hypothetical protein
MITIIEGVHFTPEDERHIRNVDPVEMRLVMEVTKSKREGNKWGESKRWSGRTIADYAETLYHNLGYRKFFKCNDPEQAKEMREAFLARFPGLRTSKKS